MHVQPVCTVPRRLALAVYLCLVHISPTLSQEMMQWDGYVTTIPLCMIDSDDNGIISSGTSVGLAGITRLRLRPTIFLSNASRLRVEYEAAAIAASRSSMPDVGNVWSHRQALDLTWTLYEGGNAIIQHFIDRLYVEAPLSFIDVTLGRQRIAWGSGRIWNPTDLFNPIRPTAFAKTEKDGVDALLGVVRAGSFTDISLVLHPQERFTSLNAGVRFRTNVSEIDVAVLGGIFDTRYTIGADIAGNLGAAGIRAEGIFTFPQKATSSASARFIAGLDQQFTESWYALIEYYRNGQGSASPERYELDRYLRGEILSLGRDYLGVKCTYLFNIVWFGGGSFIRNLGDGSSFIGLDVSHGASDELTITLGAQLYLGSGAAEFRLVPHIIFCRGELYF